MPYPPLCLFPLPFPSDIETTLLLLTNFSSHFLCLCAPNISVFHLPVQKVPRLSLLASLPVHPFLFNLHNSISLILSVKYFFFFFFTQALFHSPVISTFFSLAFPMQSFPNTIPSQMMIQTPFFFLAHSLWSCVAVFPFFFGLPFYYLWVVCFEFQGCSWFTDTSHFLSSAPKMSVLVSKQPLAPNFFICYF